MTRRNGQINAHCHKNEKASGQCATSLLWGLMMVKSNAKNKNFGSDAGSSSSSQGAFETKLAAIMLENGQECCRDQLRDKQ